MRQEVQGPAPVPRHPERGPRHGRGPKAVGDEKLTYLGYSYGTSIGQQYAQLFPTHIRAMVLDGVVDTDATGLDGAAFQADGFELALKTFLAKPMPTHWATKDLENINFDKIRYYLAQGQKPKRTWDEVPDDIKKTFERLGIPEQERKFLAGVEAQFDSEAAYSNIKETVAKQGVIFVNSTEGLREHPEIFRKFFGKVIPTVSARVVDDDMKDVAAGDVGEVVYRSPQLCLGYWEKPEETTEAFEGGWFHSGDLARIDDEGFITIVDRKKDIIKSGGVVVSSREVEEALFTHDAVREVAVIPLPDPKWIEAVTAVVVLKEGAKVEEAVLIEHAKARLAPFKVPKKVLFVDALPKNTAGKLLKRELKARFAPKG